MPMIYLVDDIESTIKRMLSDEELRGLGLNKIKVRRTLSSFRGDEIAASVFLKKYALRDADDEVAELTLEEAKDRWAVAIAKGEELFSGERKEAPYFRELYEHFLPAGRQMFALGNSQMRNVTFTNCLSGSTFVPTDAGLRKLDALSKTKVRLNGKSYMAKVWRTGSKLVRRLDTVEGYFALPTGDHRFQLVDGSWRSVDKLQPGDRIVLGHDSRPFGPSNEHEELRGFAAGLFVGVGTFAGEGFQVANVRLFGKNSRFLVEKIASLYGGSPLSHAEHISYNSTAWARDMFESTGIQHGNKTITDRLMSQSWSFLRGFLRGLFDANGCVIDSQKNHQRQIVLVQSDRDMLCRVQILLLAFGIRSVIYKGEFPKGVFQCRQGWSLHISRRSFETFAEFIGFAHPSKAAKMRTALNRAPFKPDIWYARVKSVTNFQRMDVYDMSVFGIHAFPANGLVAHNCYVTQIEDDSIEGIYGAAQKLAKTYSYGGGIGLCVGELRPAGARVSNSARQSTGSVSFMELFSLTTGLIGQAGRRGALMITMPVSHPDAEEFIEVKHGNTDKVKYANISLKLTDEFMQAVVEDRMFRQTYTTKHETVWREVRARDLWQKIIQSARDSAEPGLMFWDRMVTMSPSEIYPRLQVHSTNPCVTGDTLVATPSGWKRADLFQKGDHISTVCGFGLVERVETHHNVPVYKVEFSDGTILKVTAAHQFHVAKKDTKTEKYPRKYTPTRLDQMEVGDFVRASGFECPDLPEGQLKDFCDAFLAGVLLGDGCYTPKMTASKVVKIASDIRDNKWNELLKSKFGERGVILSCYGATDGSCSCSLTSQNGDLVSLVDEFGLVHTYSYHKRIPDHLCFGNKEQMRGVLDGLFSTDGNVNLSGDSPQIRLKSTSRFMLAQVKRMLLMFGIFSSLGNVGKTSIILGRKVKSRDRYELVVSGQSVDFFIRRIGISHPAKKALCQDLLLNWALTGNTWRVKLKSVEFMGCETVYDIYEPSTDTWITDGIVSRGCGEQILEKGGACVLGSLLLHTFVVDPFTPQARFDFDCFKQMTRRAVRHLDNVVELNFGRHALEEQEEAAQLGRRIGLGVTGLADTLAALGIKYDSEEALKAVDQVMSAKKDAEYRASIDLAMVRGPFRMFDPKAHYEQGFCATLPEEIKALGRERGQRNVAISTVAPAGSLSVIAQCSSGIEPVFALRYKRYVELGSERKEFSIRHQGLSRMAAVLGSETAPWCWVTAHSIDHRFRVAMQGVIQRHTDASISSTINLPKDAMAETVGEIYMDAWKAGLKGITVYREGAREGILVTEEFARQAGSPMDTIIYEARAEAGDKFYIPISYTGGDVRKPYQVFLINYKTSENDRFAKMGNDLVRMLREKGVEDADPKRFQKYLDRSTTQLGKITRFLSLSMKTGHFEEAVEILGEHGTVGTLAAELYKILRISLANAKVLCPNCGSSNVRMEEGCRHCLDCSWSGCG